MRLTDEELRDVLARAEEIQATTRHGDAMKAELEAVIGAAEEVGLTRSAVERALRERFDLAVVQPTVGEMAFARSADGKFYVAEVLSMSSDTARVRFIKGSEHTVTPDQLRPCRLIPGERVVVHWPWWGPWTCTVMSYDAEKRKVKVNDGWGETKTFPVSEVWLPPQHDTVVKRTRMTMMLLCSGAGLGAIIGSIITALLMR